MRFAGRTVGWSAGLIAVLCAVVTTSAGIGPVWIPPADVGKVLLNAVVVPTGISISGPAVDVTTAHVFSYAVSDLQTQIVLQVRLPRILLGAVVGFSLAAAGTIMQGIFRNPMADPLSSASPPARRSARSPSLSRQSSSRSGSGSAARPSQERWSRPSASISSRRGTAAHRSRRCCWPAWRYRRFWARWSRSCCSTAARASGGRCTG